jgi:hypothetical protein
MYARQEGALGLGQWFALLGAGLVLSAGSAGWLLLVGTSL